MIISVINLKGGSGKTTTAMALATAAARHNRNVSVLDTDPQGDATTWAGDAEDAGETLPFTVDSANIGKLKRLRKTMADDELVIIDCPPEELPEGKPHRFGGLPLLTAAVAGVTLATGLMAVYLYALPQDDALLTAVGGVTPLVTFHRGDCTVAPENTLPAFRSAILKGGDRIELDVQMTRDGVVMVTHDTSLRRCTGRNENIYDLTCNEVRKLDAGRWFGQKYTVSNALTASNQSFAKMICSTLPCHITQRPSLTACSFSSRAFATLTGE